MAPFGRNLNWIQARNYDTLIISWFRLISSGLIQQICHFWVASWLCFPTSLRAQYLSYKNEFDLHEKKSIGVTHFCINSFGRRLFLTQRQKATRKWCIYVVATATLFGYQKTLSQTLFFYKNPFVKSTILCLKYNNIDGVPLYYDRLSRLLFHTW